MIDAAIQHAEWANLGIIIAGVILAVLGTIIAMVGLWALWHMPPPRANRRLTQDELNKKRLARLVWRP